MTAEEEREDRADKRELFRLVRQLTADFADHRVQFAELATTIEKHKFCSAPDLCIQLQERVLTMEQNAAARADIEKHETRIRTLEDQKTENHGRASILVGLGGLAVGFAAVAEAWFLRHGG